VVALHGSRQEIEELKVLIEDKMQHTYLDKNIEKSMIDEEKLCILNAMINNTSMKASEKKQTIITTMLVQIALDTHDMVPISNDEKESEASRVPKQLTVLAGDYYSGLYYFLLSELKAYDMIQVLASAIKEINEYKMKLYYRELDSFESYILLLKKIESLLILQIAEYIKKPVLIPIIEEWLVTKRLMEETNNFDNNRFSPIIHTWLNFSKEQDDSSIVTSMKDIIIKNTNRIEEHTLRLSDQHKLFKTYILSGLKKLGDKTSVMEEG